MDMFEFMEEFVEFDFCLGADVFRCFKCGHIITTSLLFPQTVECDKCKTVIKR